MEPRDDIALRPPTADDAPAVAEVLRARDVADYGAPDYTLEDLRDEWRLPGVDLAADAVVAETAENRIAGYAIIRRPGGLAVVSPEHERRGIGARLLRWTEERERALQRTSHKQWIAGGNARARELLLAAGYTHERSYWRMARALEASPRAPAPAQTPPGIDLRPLDRAADAEALHRLDAQSFGANADYRPESLQEFTEEHLNAHDLAPELSLVAESRTDGRVGFLLARRWEGGLGYVDLLAVHPDHRRRGLATALLRTAFARFGAAGLHEAQLGVASDNPRALALYERLGMAPRFRADTYQRPIA